MISVKKLNKPLNQRSPYDRQREDQGVEGVFNGIVKGTERVMSFNKVMFSSATDEWSTPKEVYDALDSEFRFDFDPCPLSSHFGDGLSISWRQSNFVNPPYSDISNWIKKGWNEYTLGKTVVFLIPSRTDTRWWHDYVMKATEIRFIKGRLKFGGAKNSAPFPSCIVIFKNPHHPQQEW